MAFNTFTVDCSTDLASNQLEFDYTDGGGTGTLQDFSIEQSFDNISYNSIGLINYNGDGTYTYDDINTNGICDILVYYRVQPRNTLLADYEVVSSSASCTKDCSISPTDPSQSPQTNCGSINQGTGITVSWLAYEGPAAHLPYVTTRIYKSINGSAFSLLATVASNVTTYLDMGIAAGLQYQYYIQHEFELYETTSTVSTSSIICTIGSDCKDSTPITSYPLELNKDNECTVYIEDLMESSGQFNVPSIFDCRDISSISSIELKFYNCKDEDSTEGYESLTPSYTYWNVTNQRFEFPDLDDGIWKFSIKVTYSDSNNNKIVVYTTKCIYLDCCHKCALAKETLDKPELLDLFLLMEVIDIATECNDCNLACTYYTYLYNNIKKYDCNC